MPYSINETCIACNFCLPACPVHAITEGPEIFEINPQTCCDCLGYHPAPQCVEICPVEGAITKLAT